MNALQKIKLSKELLATTASLKGGQLKALEKIKASKRALEIVGLLGGGSVKPDTSKYDGYIKIAADSIAELRLVDVERVLSESGLKGEELSAFGDYIIKNRPDLEGEVNDLVGEMFSGGTRQPRDKDYTPLLNSIINGDVSVFDDKAKLTELVGAAQESGGDDMPDDKKGLFIEAVEAAGIQLLEGLGFLWACQLAF